MPVGRMVVGRMEGQRLLLACACQFVDQVGSQIVGFCAVWLFVRCGLFCNLGCWVGNFLVGVKSHVVVSGFGGE